ncbi:MAG: hypothetical protein ACP5G1_04315 [Nanopusillaceae archaeon]
MSLEQALKENNEQIFNFMNNFELFNLYNALIATTNSNDFEIEFEKEYSDSIRKMKITSKTIQNNDIISIEKTIEIYVFERYEDCEEHYNGMIKLENDNIVDIKFDFKEIPNEDYDDEENDTNDEDDQE